MILTRLRLDLILMRMMMMVMMNMVMVMMNMVMVMIEGKMVNDCGTAVLLSIRGDQAGAKD